MKTEIKIKNKVYKIEVSELKENLTKITINGKDYFFTQDEFGRLIKAEKENLASFSFDDSQVLGEFLKENEIKSPIAGTISTILVKVGEKIKPNQKVLTLISMKMENEIISETHGEVKEIKAKENQFVNSGDVLIVLS